MKSYFFRVVIEEDAFEDGKMAYHAYCPILKGASTWGYTKQEALKNIREVLEMTVESMKDHGEEIPEEPSEKTLVSSEPLVSVIEKQSRRDPSGREDTSPASAA